MVAATAARGVHRVEQIMGMPIVVDARDVDGDGALDPLFDWFRFVDETFSTYKSDSTISRLNRGEFAVGDAPVVVHEVLRRCDELRAETRGFFDVHAASDDQLDPSGLVKGWSVDRAAALAHDLGWRNYAINAGGDMRVVGGALPHPEWRVGIQHPLMRDEVVAVVAGTDLAVATSGGYTRGDHVFDPHTHEPAQGLLSVTIVGPNLANADAYATAAFAMGERAPAWIARLRGYEGLAITSDSRSLRTPGFPLVAE